MGSDIVPKSVLCRLDSTNARCWIEPLPQRCDPSAVMPNQSLRFRHRQCIGTCSSVGLIPAQHLKEHQNYAMCHGNNCSFVTDARCQSLVSRPEDRAGFIGLDAPHAHSISVVRSHGLPRNTGARLRFPALSLLPGHAPAQELQRGPLPNTPMSMPTSARMAAAACFLMPGMVCNSA